MFVTRGPHLMIGGPQLQLFVWIEHKFNTYETGDKHITKWHNIEINIGVNGQKLSSTIAQRVRDAIITLLWRPNDVVTSFRRHDDVVIASCVRWDVSSWDGRRKTTLMSIKSRSYLTLPTLPLAFCPTDCSIISYHLSLRSKQRQFW